MNRVHKTFDSYRTKHDGTLISKKILALEFNTKRINCSIGVFGVHDHGKKSSFKRIIHCDFFVSCKHILKHTCCVVIFAGVYGRDLLLKDLQIIYKVLKYV